MKISAIVLAAGRSLRFGGEKMHAPWHGQPLLSHALATVAALPVSSRVLVAKDGLALPDTSKGFTIIINDRPQDGLSRSIQLGIAASGDSDGYLFLAADQPLVSPDLLQTIIASFRAESAGIICAGNGSHLGNPALFHRRYRAELMALKGDIGGRAIIAAHLSDTLVISAPAPALLDIDTPKDYQKLLTL